MYSICLPWAIFPLTNPNFWTLNCLSFDLRFGFLLIAPDYSLFPLLYPLIVPLISSNFPFFLITPLLSSDLTVGIFRSLLWLPIWYLLIAPSIFPDCSLVPSNFPFCIFWLPLWYLLIPSSVSSDYPFCIFWLSLLYLLIIPFVSSDNPFVIFLFPVLISSNFLLGGYWDCRSLVRRRVNQNPSFDKEQTTQWPKG
jgi:hypothetical protein